MAGIGIGSAEQVDFHLTQGGVTLNRVTGNNVSNIFGKLTSNGDLWLINPNGILFGANSQVDVHGLLATTSDISNADFLSSNYNFGIPSSLSSTVVNRGSITAAEGGLVALVAPGVQNMGIITARLGKVSLASGTTFTVDLYGDQLINLGVDSKVMGQVTGMDGEVLSSLVTNSGSIFADGGVVRLDVNAAQGIVDRVINMDGVIQAHSVSEQNGTIILSGGDAGEVKVTGTLDASGYGEGETGGTIHVLGDMLNFSGNGLIDVSGDLGGGTLLFGGDYQGQGSVPNATDVFVGPNTQTFADAVTNGNGGKLIFWADRRMRFYGIVKGRGGKYFGDGGFVEVSGKEELFFDGSVDTTAANGKTGTLLLDPTILTIAKGAGDTTSGAISGIGFNVNNATIFEETLEALSATTNVILLADILIQMEALGDGSVGGTLDMKQTAGHSVTFRVLDGDIKFLDTADTISTRGGDIIFDATGVLTLGNLNSNGGDILLTGGSLILPTSTALNAGAGNISLSTTGGITALGGLTLDVSGSITLTGNLIASGGAVTLTATSGITLNNNITDSSSLIIDAKSSTLSLANGVVLESAGALTLTAGNVSSLGDLTLTSTGSTIIVNSAVASAGAVSMTAVSGLFLNNSTLTGVGNIDLQGGSGLTLVSGMGITSTAGNITLGGGSITANGALTFSSNGSITISNALSQVSAGSATLNAGSGITLNDFTVNGTVSLNSGTGTSVLAGSLSTTSNALTVTASDLNLTGSINASATTINASTSVDLGLGSPSSFTGMDISTAELAKITGDLNLVNGNITVGLGAISVTGKLTIGQSGGTITGQGALTLAAVNGLVINSENISSAGNLTLGNIGTDASISLASGTVLTATGGSITLNATTGGTSAAGAATFNADSGISIKDNLTVAGVTTFDADANNDSTGTFTTDAGKTINTNNNILSITAAGMAADGSLNSGNSGTSVLASNGQTIGLGLGAGTLSLDDGELSRITASSLTIGDATNGDINVDAVSAGSFGALTLNATAIGASVAFGAASSFSQGLTVNAADRITIASGLSTLSTNTSADANTHGATTFNADLDGVNTGDFELTSGNVNTNGNSLAIKSNLLTLALGETLSSGTASTTIQTSRANTTIGLGTGSGTFALTTGKLSQITAGSLIVGDNTNGDINVGGLTTISTPLTLNATKTGSAVNFSNALSSGLGDLTINAGTGGVNFAVDVSTTGNMSVTSGGAITDTGTLLVDGTSSFTTNVADQAITLDSALNSFKGAVSLNTTGTGDATLISDNAVTLSTSTVGRDLNVTVDGGNSLNVTGKATAGGPITLSADDDIIFTAAGDLSTDGNISVKADDDILADAGSGGALTMVDGTVFNAGSGNLVLSADEDITIGRVETSSASDTAVTLTSISGGVVDGDTALPPEFTSIGGDSTPWLDVDAANGRLVADVATGFGAENAIETKVKSLDIANSTSGRVDIFEFDDLDIFKINNAGGSTEVSFEGELTGRTNCVGTCLFVRRDIRNELIGSKSLGQLANASNEQLKFDIFELNGQSFFDKTPADHVASSPNGPFTADLFSEKFELVELAAGTDGKFDGMEVSQTFWGGPKQPTLEVAEWNAPNKKKHSRQRSAKRKKRSGKKVDDTASITMKKSFRKVPKPRIQKSESGYLGFAP